MRNVSDILLAGWPKCTDIKSIKIDPEGRYILVVNGLRADGVQAIADALRAWWETDDKIAVIHGPPGIEFHIERVDE